MTDRGEKILAPAREATAVPVRRSTLARLRGNLPKSKTHPLTRLTIPVSRDAGFSRSRALQIFAEGDAARSTFLKNVLIGNGAGLGGIAALLGKWPEAAPLIYSLTPSAIAFALGVVSAALCGLFLVTWHRRNLAIFVWRAELVAEAQAREEPWKQKRARISKVERRISRLEKREPPFTRLLSFALLCFAVGLFLAIIAVVRSLPAPPSKEEVRPAPTARLFAP